MPDLSLVNFNIVCATIGGFITVFGLVSYLLKEKFYLSEALISTIGGVIFSPHAANFIRPLEYANNNAVDLETITLYFTRLVLGVQLVLAGVQLPSKYLWTEWKSLSLLLGPGMCIMWISTALLVWAMVPHINFVMALIVGACVTPTDPILSNSIVKGKFADKNIPPNLQKIIIAESGANDGLGYPFLFLGLYLLRYVLNDGLGSSGGAGHAMALWFGNTWAYVILLSVIYGAVVGWIAKELLHWAEEHHYVDRESFLVFAVTLALFIVGTVGLIGSDDVLACFIAGNAFTWDDWFRLETEDDSLQPTIDMLLNVAVFMWFGAVCPWHKFVDNSVIPIYRLIPLGIMVLLFRRLPMVLAFHKGIHQVEEWRHAGFVGFFGPIGVSAIFYLYISREYLREVTVDGVIRQDAEHVAEVLNVVVWFLTVCSIFVHGLSIPAGKLGFYLPRTISTAISSERTSRSPSRVRNSHEHSTAPGRLFRARDDEMFLLRSFRRRRPTTSEIGPADNVGTGMGRFFNSIRNLFRHVFSSEKEPEGASVGQGHGTDANPGKRPSNPAGSGSRPEISHPIDGRVLGRAIKQDTRARSPPGVSSPVRTRAVSPVGESSEAPSLLPGDSTPARSWHRSIRFPDEVHSKTDVPSQHIGDSP